MPLSPRKNENLYNSNHAAVSLDSFLGLLSSTYGTEQLDSRIIFEKDQVNWANISVENLRALPRKDDVGKRHCGKVDVKVNAGTSTTSLRNRNIDGEIDETLLSIKSLTSLQQIKSELDNATKESKSFLTNNGNEEVVECVSKSCNLDVVKQNEIEDQTITEENTGDYTQVMTPVCGFRVDDINNQIILDIQFVPKAPIESKIMPSFDTGEPNILINIIDTLKPMESSVRIAKSSLVSKIKYFEEVEKEFGLDNLDIIVRCNFGIFQWLLQWISSEIPMCKPNLNLVNLKSVLTMANHLGVEKLVQECLDFLRQNIDKVLELDEDIENVFHDETLLLEFAKRFSNTDVENLKHESLRTMLFITLIKMLAEPEPCHSFGHFYSLSTIFQCGLCEKIMHNRLAKDIPCRADCTQMTFDGKLEFHHECSSSWNLTDYLTIVFDKLRDWRMVYWYLWGMCHFFYCEICCSWYPLGLSDWCSYHPGEVEYFPMGNNLHHPIGTYRCCGEKAFRFDVVKQNCGCKYKSHVTKLDTLEKVEMFNIHQEHKNAINIPPREDNSNVKKFVKLVKKSDGSSDLKTESPSEKFWWSGIILSPAEKADYSMIPLRVLNILRNRQEKRKEPKIHSPLSLGAHISFGGIISLQSKISECESAVEDTSAVLKTPINKKVKPTLCVKNGKSSSVCFVQKDKNKKKKSCSNMYQPVEMMWNDAESNKDNQDNQRDFEEISMRKLVQMLTPADCSGPSKDISAGSYIRLETEWWQRNCGSHSNKNSSTVVNRTFPLSWFRKLTL
ncbi:SANT and BTB domain regulator of class switch recombination-like [Macrosteles quadrilineatus]|uniref:SANT and BTB domain regulator of class switch recombination-like n=1 Tax=Macrosteles quadrilineatus TaxID=74068 RepID=UPI0023E297A2|nr:SANT and BTB domain regulator of class switch recombination-like [Macrosteles quadrilineatus]